MCAERRVKVAAILSVVLGGPSMRGLSLGTLAAAKLCRGQQGCTCDALHEIFLSVQPLAGGGTMFGLWLHCSTVGFARLALVHASGQTGGVSCKEMEWRG